MPIELTKRQKSEVRALLGLAWERELETALSDLEQDFRRWRAGEIDAFELNQRIHTYHNGPSRKIWAQYAGASVDLILVAGALRAGILRREEVSQELQEKLVDVLGWISEGSEDADGEDGESPPP